MQIRAKTTLVDKTGEYIIWISNFNTKLFLFKNTEEVHPDGNILIV